MRKIKYNYIITERSQCRSDSIIVPEFDKNPLY